MEQYVADRIIDVYTGKGGKIGDTEYDISRSSGYTVIAFGGSSSTIDWVKNAYALPWYERGMGLCHRGFLLSARKVYNHIDPKSLKWPLIIGGHSKGGAEATLFAAMMARDGIPPAYLYTYGAPKCGGDSLAKALKDVEIKRFVNGADIVPHLPPDIPFINLYNHPRLSIKLDGHWIPNTPDAIRDHSMSSYKDGMTKPWKYE